MDLMKEDTPQPTATTIQPFSHTHIQTNFYAPPAPGHAFRPHLPPYLPPMYAYSQYFDDAMDWSDYVYDEQEFKADDEKVDEDGMEEDEEFDMEEDEEFDMPPLESDPSFESEPPLQSDSPTHIQEPSEDESEDENVYGNDMIEHLQSSDECMFIFYIFL